MNKAYHCEVHLIGHVIVKARNKPEAKRMFKTMSLGKLSKVMWVDEGERGDVEEAVTDG